MKHGRPSSNICAPKCPYVFPSPQAFRIPLGAVGFYLAAKYTPVRSDGESGEPRLIFSDAPVESMHSCSHRWVNWMPAELGVRSSVVCVSEVCHLC